MTAPGRMSFNISRVTSLGALAPWINTAPISTSARRRHSSRLIRFDMSVVTFSGRISSRYRIRRGFTSRR